MLKTIWHALHSRCNAMDVVGVAPASITNYLNNYNSLILPVNHNDYGDTCFEEKENEQAPPHGAGKRAHHNRSQRGSRCIENSTARIHRTPFLGTGCKAPAGDAAHEGGPAQNHSTNDVEMSVVRSSRCRRRNTRVTAPPTQVVPQVRTYASVARAAEHSSHEIYTDAFPPLSLPAGCSSPVPARRKEPVRGVWNGMPSSRFLKTPTPAPAPRLWLVLRKNPVSRTFKIRASTSPCAVSAVKQTDQQQLPIALARTPVSHVPPELHRSSDHEYSVYHLPSDLVEDLWYSEGL